MRTLPGDPSTSYDLTRWGVGARLALVRQWRRWVFGEHVSLVWHFPSRVDLCRQLARMQARLLRPVRTLADVPWPRCWPRGRAIRERSSFLGTLSIRQEGVRERIFSLAYAPDCPVPILCFRRDDVEALHLAFPADFLEIMLAECAAMGGGE